MHAPSFPCAFLSGVAVPRDSEIVRRTGHQLQDFPLIVLLPVFFAGVGPNTSIGPLRAVPGCRTGRRRARGGGSAVEPVRTATAAGSTTSTT
ncbi:hypothetical protein ACF08M_22760 [Streptomyces sp. NPDC015032]|uniref:hypothetical protein n=1 Tax=Streptomyces sp. NPDC015032 TaxID=3364937 RepID=UPI0036FF3732